MSYRARCVNTSMGVLAKPTSILLQNDVWEALDKVARHKNRTKTQLLRPVIAAYVKRETKRMRHAEPVQD